MRMLPVHVSVISQVDTVHNSINLIIAASIAPELEEEQRSNETRTTTSTITTNSITTMKSIKSDFVRTRFGGTRRSSSKSSRSSRLAYGAVAVLVTCGMLGYHALLPDMDASREFLTQNTRGLFSLAAGNEEGGGASSSFGSTIMFGSNTEVATSDADAATTVVDKSKYTPAMVEQYIYDHRIQLGYEPDNEEEASEGCRVWNDPQETPIYHELQYRQEIVEYWDAVKEYSWIEDNKITDVRPYLEQGVCKHLEVDPKGRYLQDAFFSKSQQLSKTNSSGFVENGFDSFVVYGYHGLLERTALRPSSL